VKIGWTFLLLLASVLPAAEVQLSADLPVTDARWSWTYSGRMPPLFDRNLSGNPISIGGEHMNNGICGHVPFSMVYNVRGTADGFTALIGLEGEDHPKDIERKDAIAPSVMIEIRVDRETVFKREIKLGAPAVPVWIDLHGKTQIELRGDSGKGSFQRHRIAWGKPVFLCTRPELLRTTLAQEKQKRDTIFTTPRSYPPPPAWKNIAIKKITWQGYHNAYEINNGVLKAIFVPEMGGRIIWLSGQSGQNLLCDRLPQDRNPIPARGRAEDMTGGHFIRLLPQDYFIPTDPVLEQGPYDVSFPAEGVIAMRSSSSPIFLVKYEYRFEFQPNNGQVKVGNRIQNTAPFPHQAGVWSLTRLPGGKVTKVVIPHSLAKQESHFKIRNEKGAAKVIRENGVFRVKLAESIPRDFFLELLCSSLPMVLLAEFNSGNRLNITYQAKADKPGIVHIFADRFFTELEGHGNVVFLRPGDSCSLNETWSFDLAETK